MSIADDIQPYYNGSNKNTTSEISQRKPAAFSKSNLRDEYDFMQTAKIKLKILTNG